MTCDSWKTTGPSPYDYDDEALGECDCCGKWRVLSRCWAGELETFACDECRGAEPDHDAAYDRKRDDAMGDGP
jgi:hypothetical protein